MHFDILVIEHGEKIRSFPPPNADELKKAKFTFEIGFTTDDPTQTGIGYIDDVNIGTIGQ